MFGRKSAYYKWFWLRNEFLIHHQRSCSGCCSFLVSPFKTSSNIWSLYNAPQISHLGPVDSALRSHSLLNGPQWRYLGLISGGVFELTIEILRKIFLLCLIFWWFNQVINLLMPRQVKCLGIVKILTWFGYQSLFQSKMYLHQIVITNWRYSLWNVFQQTRSLASVAKSLVSGPRWRYLGKIYRFARRIHLSCKF